MIEIEEWGLIDFNEAWERQRILAADVLKGEKRSTLVLCEHPTVITIGRNGTDANVIATTDTLTEKRVNVIPINRGGDVTLHNPGQLVGYPIFKLTDFREDLHWFLREIEECIIATIGQFGVLGSRVDGSTGVWIEHQRKVCAIGIHCSRWVTSHGFALNVNNDIREFEMIIPCGITDKEVTSIEIESSDVIIFQKVKEICASEFLRRFS
ncbi:MAG: lipoyl(octanoyl) transferase LipB [Ignavibacteriae bacterium]|nr:lipoyl(octanoyl) transferase LipB [Ignavibacteriota bacterium]